MGTHSAFFIPAKYGMMPEMLHTSILSRGNGLLEGTSFVANILGTVLGGLLYGLVKSKVDVHWGRAATGARVDYRRGFVGAGRNRGRRLVHDRAHSRRRPPQEA